MEDDPRLKWAFLALGAASYLSWNGKSFLPTDVTRMNLPDVAMITATPYFLARLTGSPALQETFSSYMSLTFNMLNLFALIHATATAKQVSENSCYARVSLIRTLFEERCAFSNTTFSRHSHWMPVTIVHFPIHIDLALHLLRLRNRELGNPGVCRRALDHIHCHIGRTIQPRIGASSVRRSINSGSVNQHRRADIGNHFLADETGNASDIGNRAGSPAREHDRIYVLRSFHWSIVRLNADPYLAHASASQRFSRRPSTHRQRWSLKIE